MKRRNVEAGKPRRPLKRTNKFGEGVYGSSFIYLKFVLIWCLVLLADFVLEFRFEYLWPFWLLLRSVCDSFKYQGLALSVFFVCIAITSDMICLLFIPIQWLFFMASTYVWVQYVWHTDRGICLPTVSLWLLFMYIEATVRLKDLKNSPFHVDLCRPFAAHCIGYPVVTLGFGFKSYVQYRLQLRTQREVQKKNDFYFELLRKALPLEQQQPQNALPSSEKNSIKDSEAPAVANGVVPQATHGQNVSNSSKKDKHQANQKSAALQDSNNTSRNAQSSNNENSSANGSSSTSKSNNSSFNNSSGHHGSSSKKIPHQHNNNLSNGHDRQLTPSSSQNDIHSSGTELRRRNTTSNSSPTLNSTSKKGSSAAVTSSSQDNVSQNTGKNSSSRSSSVSSGGSNSPKSGKQSNGHAVLITDKQAKLSSRDVNEGNEESVKPSKKAKNDDTLRIEELESCVSKLKRELNSTRQCEGDLRMKNDSLLNDEKSAKNELAQLRRDNDQLQTKLHNLVNSKQKDKQNLLALEKRLKAETEVREAVENVLREERKKRKEEEETAARAVALAASNRDKESAKEHKRNLQELEREFDNLRKHFTEKDERCRELEKEITDLQQREKAAKESETLMSALAAMQEKNLMLEKSLSAETRLKLDLFSALGDAKRQLEIAHSVRCQREVEIRELKSRVADVLSVLPESQMRSSTPHYSANFLEKQQGQASVQLSPTQHYSAGFCPIPVAPISPPAIDTHPMVHAPAMMPQSPGMVQQMPLDPNAAVYTPASSGV